MASPTELEWLVADGRTAVARMVASVTGLAHHVANRGPFRDHDDTAQALVLAAIAAAHTWNPAGGRSWAGWAGQQMDWKLSQILRDQQRHSPEVPIPLTSGHDPQLVDDTVQLSSIATVQSALATLTDDQRRIITARFGLEGGLVMRGSDIARLTGHTPRHVYDQIDQILHLLRPHLDPTTDRTSHGWAPPTRTSQPPPEPATPPPPHGTDHPGRKTR